MTATGIGQIVLYAVVLVALGVPLGAYMARVYSGEARIAQRVLGPLERLFIVGLGLGGQLTAAAVVVAAKGLLRWPELSSRLEQERVHRLTEYFLLGSFVSWLVALSGLALLR